MRPNLSYFICATARSGSSLLCGALRYTGVAGYPAEYFYEANYRIACERWGFIPPSFPDYLNKIIEESITPNGIFGIKMFIDNIQDRRFLELPEYSGQNLNKPELMSAIFPNLRYIWITRRNKIRQAISYWRAKQTEIWHISEGENRQPKNTPVYDCEQIQLALEELIVEEMRWQWYFRMAGMQPLTIVYEDFILRYDETIRQILKHLDIEVGADQTWKRPPLRKQADDLSEDWVKRFCEDKGWG